MIPIAEPVMGERERARVLAVLEDGQLADGPEVRAFEREFAAYSGADFGVATSNGTTALHAALVGLGVGPGDRVLTTPFSFVATANAARLVGCEVEFVDIDPETYAIDPDELEARLRSGPAVDAVIAVHLFGLPADLDQLTELTEAHGCYLIEDAAQAHGATYCGDRVGSFGDAACFSFYPTKNMTTGEGGMVLTDRAEVADRTARFIDHGRTEGYHHESVGHNFRMTSLAAAIGRVQLDRLPGFIERRQQHAKRYSDALDSLPITTPTTPDDRTHVYHQYTIETDHRDRLQASLGEAGIGTGVYYPIPINRQPAYAGHTEETPVADGASERVLSLPVHPGLDVESVDRVVDAVSGFMEVAL